MKIPLIFAVVFVAGCASGPATPTQMMAAEHENKLESIGVYLENIRRLRAEYDSGERGPLKPRERETFVESQETLERILVGVESVGELNEDERIAVYNAQGAINAIVLGNIEDRPICRRGVAKTGSRIRKTECYTAAERERMKRAAEQNAEYIRVLISSRIDGPRG